MAESRFRTSHGKQQLRQFLGTRQHRPVPGGQFGHGPARARQHREGRQSGRHHGPHLFDREGGGDQGARGVRDLGGPASGAQHQCCGLRGRTPAHLCQIARRESGRRDRVPPLAVLVEGPGRHRVRVLLHTTLEQAARRIPSAAATLVQTAEGVLLETRAERFDTMAGYLAGLGCPLTVHHPAELREALIRLSDRLASGAASGGRTWGPCADDETRCRGPRPP
ncbi:WCX domain-containing protein [Streptomyces griseofuscus]|uniref:WYL domain-containing protein n=1 Tax=Streptomyces griseofuscus TaxID=146922 RepID=UPI0038150765